MKCFFGEAKQIINGRSAGKNFSVVSGVALVSQIYRLSRFTFYHVLMASFIFQPVAPSISYAEDVEDRFKETCTAITVDLDDPNASDAKICRSLKKIISDQKRAGGAGGSKPIKLPAVCRRTGLKGESDDTSRPSGSLRRGSHSDDDSGEYDGGGDEEFNVYDDLREETRDLRLKDAWPGQTARKLKMQLILSMKE